MISADLELLKERGDIDIGGKLSPDSDALLDKELWELEPRTGLDRPDIFSC